MLLQRGRTGSPWCKHFWSLEGDATGTFWRLGTFAGCSLLGTDISDRDVFICCRLKNYTSQCLCGFCFSIPFLLAPCGLPAGNLCELLQVLLPPEPKTQLWLFQVSPHCLGLSWLTSFSWPHPQVSHVIEDISSLRHTAALKQEATISWATLCQMREGRTQRLPGEVALSKQCVHTYTFVALSFIKL